MEDLHDQGVEDAVSTPSKRVRFFIDPSLADEEIAEGIIQMTEEHFDISDEAPSDE